MTHTVFHTSNSSSIYHLYYYTTTVILYDLHIYFCFVFLFLVVYIYFPALDPLYYLTGIFFTAILVFREGEGFEKSFLFLFLVLQFGSWSILFTSHLRTEKLVWNFLFLSLNYLFCLGLKLSRQRYTLMWLATYLLWKIKIILK